MTGGKRLSEQEFRSFFTAPMRDVTASADPVLDIWPYIDALDPADLGGPCINDVRYVYRDALDRFDQVIVGTGRFNALLVIVVDLSARMIVGHHLLDLGEEGDVDSRAEPSSRSTR